MFTDDFDDPPDLSSLSGRQKHIQRRTRMKFNDIRSCYKLGRFDLIKEDFPFNRIEWKYGLSKQERQFFYAIREQAREKRLAAKVF